MANFCGKCGTSISQSDIFCYKCGERTKNNIELKKESKEYDNDKRRILYLVKELKEGNNDVFGEFYELTKNYMFFTLSKIIRDKDAINDLVQDSYIVVYQNLNTLRDINAILKWMGRIAHNKAYNYLRANSREMLLKEDTTTIEEIIESDYALLPEESMQNKEVQRLLKEIIDELPQMQRLAVIAFYYNEMSIQETAETLDIPVGTVKTNLYRARAKIKVAVEELASKKNTKLYSASLAALLLFLFQEEAKACEIPTTIHNSLNKFIQQQNIYINKNSNSNTLLNSTSKIVNSRIKSSLAKKIIILIISIGTVTTSIGMVNYLSKSTPEKTIKKFEYCYNNQDIEGMVMCLEPRIQKLYSGVMKFVSGISGYSTQEILSSTVDLFYDTDINNISEINFEIISVDYYGDLTAEVSVLLTLFGDDIVYEDDGIIKMEKHKKRWLINVY